MISHKLGNKEEMRLTVSTPLCLYCCKCIQVPGATGMQVKGTMTVNAL